MQSLEALRPALSAHVPFPCPVPTDRQWGNRSIFWLPVCWGSHTPVQERLLLTITAAVSAASAASSYKNPSGEVSLNPPWARTTGLQRVSPTRSLTHILTWVKVITVQDPYQDSLSQILSWFPDVCLMEWQTHVYHHFNKDTTTEFSMYY